MDPEHPSTPPHVESAPDLPLLDDVEGELDDVEAALGRLDEGTYGVCEVCGAHIDDERLSRQPATRFCAEHAPA
ncbi:MAG: TraR/DksA family transcriptional regulator [Actinomycetota bacterium]